MLSKKYLNAYNLSSFKNLVAYLFIIVIFFYFSIKNYFYFNNLFYSHAADGAFFADLMYRVAIFNDYNASTIFNSYYHYIEYLSKEPEAFCSLDSLSNSKKFNMYQSAHLYWIVWILSFPIRLGIDPISLSSFLIVSIYFILILTVIIICYNKKINPIFCILLLLLLFLSWRPIIDSLYGQPYFDKFFIIFMCLFIFTHQNLIFNKNKNIILYIFAFLVVSVNERSALMLAGYIIVSEFFDKVKNPKEFNLNKSLLILSLILLFYYFGYTKFYQLSPYSSTISIDNAVRSIKMYLTFENTTFVLSNKLILVCLPLFVLSIYSPKFAIISLGALLPNLLFTVGGAEKTGFSSHYHAYYIPFLISAVLVSFVNFCKKGYDKKVIKIVYLVISIMIYYNLSINISDTKASLKFDKPKFNGNFVRSVDNKDKLHLLELKEFEIKLSKEVEFQRQSSISMNEHLMTGFVKTNLRVDYFPIGIYSNDLIIVQKNKIKYNKYLISFTYYQDIEEKRLQINNCLSDYIKKNFKEISKTHFQGSDYILLKRL